MTKNRIVVLSGAGISAESGLRTFRDSNGLWENYAIEDVATPEAWQKNPELVLQFYNQRRRQLKEAHPNKAHLALAELEKDFEVQIITQNVDDLHERAGSSNVLHLHGSLLSKCSSSDKSHNTYVNTDMTLDDYAPDGSRFRPDIVWFGESVTLFDKAIAIAETADIFLVIGTSLQVYPAANLVSYVRPNAPIFIIDKNIPLVTGLDFVGIQETATKGITVFMEKLKNLNYLE
jgi:NAD-dependent deacetylase